MLKKILPFLAVCMLFGCTAEREGDIIDLSQVVVSLEQIQVGEITYAFPVISGLGNSDIDAKANTTLKGEFFITDDNGEVRLGFYMRNEPEITTADVIFLSQDFITINMVSMSFGAKVYTESSYCTLNIRTGELVRLGELVNLSDEFVAFIDEGNYTYPMYKIRDFRGIVDEANLNNLEYFDWRNAEGDRRVYISNKRSFFLEDEILWIKHAQSNSSIAIRISIEYITDFLIRKDADYKNSLGPSELRDGDAP